MGYLLQWLEPALHLLASLSFYMLVRGQREVKGQADDERGIDPITWNCQC